MTLWEILMLFIEIRQIRLPEITAHRFCSGEMVALFHKTQQVCGRQLLPFYIPVNMIFQIGVVVLKICFERLGPKLPRYYMQIMLIVILLFCMTISASAVENMWDAAERIIKDVYTKIAGISTVLAGLMSAVAVVGAKVSNNQHKTDQAWDWLKRIWLCWIVINGIGAFLAYIQPLFNGLATLEPGSGTSTP